MTKIRKEAYSYIKDMFIQHNMVKRTVFSVLSVLIMGFGIALFSVSGFGVDPFTSMNMNIASAIGMRFGTYQLIINLSILIFVIIVAHRGLAGVGTIANMIGVGYTCEFFQEIMSNAFEPYLSSLSLRIVLLAIGMAVISFSSSLFFTANVGVGPYDALGFMLSNATHIPFKWVRVATDFSVIFIGIVLSGGLQAILSGDFSAIKNVGIGTIINAFCLGPFVNFFNAKVSSKIMNVDYERISRDVAFFMIKGAMVKNLGTLAEVKAPVFANAPGFRS